MKARRALIVFILFLFGLILPQSAWAVSITISNSPSAINNDPFTIIASISGATAGTNYLKVDIFKDQTSNYFGETFNNTDWYGGSTFSQYLPITILSGQTWNGSIQARVGSPSSSDYDAQGAYKIRLRRYTSGGGYTSSEANNSAVFVTINIPTQTPTPTLTPTPAPSNTPTPTPKITQTPTPTQKPTPSLSKSASKTPSPTANKEKASVLGVDSSVNEKGTDNTKKEEIKIASSSQTNILPKIFIILGVVFIASCGIVISYPYIKDLRRKFE